MKIQTKLSLLFIGLSFGVILAASIFSATTLEEYFRSRIISELQTHANQVEYVLRTGVQSDSDRYTRLQQFIHTAKLRLTLIDKDGNVLFESELPRERLSSVENHLLRPEVQEALQSGVGVSTRHSTTLDTEMLYYAKTILDPTLAEAGFRGIRIIRLGIPLTQVSEVMSTIRFKIIIVSITVLLVVAGVSIIVARRITQPVSRMVAIAEEIRSGKLEKRIPVTSRDELGTLGETLNGMLDKLNEDITQLKKLERMRSEFLGNVSHELRTPIFAIQGMLETLLQGALDDEEVRKDFVERALANTRRLNTLLGDLIEISRIQSGEMKMSFRYFSLHEFLAQIVAEMQPAVRAKNITLALLNERDAIQVLGDKDRLKQLMVNLIDNAIKYTAHDGSVEVSYKLVDGNVRVSVRDTGVGIPPEHLPRIFERFYRIDKERSRGAGGTGLGLAIVKHISEAHGSNVEVQSETGKGSIFSFTLKT
ncbi:MAG TPA: ATP-binding protein [Bacteroidota bacterium]|jgi:two-component system phosphate regulon sensor histidine kinase PhoR|nr:ATP-binding protein [Bacteroidota bacterium]